MLIGIFGGAFDPVHLGHLNLAENILLKTEIEKILFIPTARPPHKPLAPVTSFEHRFRMVELAIAGNTSYEISGIEKKLADKFSYSLLTVRELQKIYKNARFSMIIGGDSLKMLHTWFRAKELIQECDIISYPRPGYDIDIKYLKKHWPDDTAQKLYSSIVKLPLTDISSTKIRAEFYVSEECRKFLPASVMDYITENNLYLKDI